MRAAVLVTTLTSLTSLALMPASSAAPAPEPLPPAAIAQELRSLRTLGTVLHVGAHPDDENTELITYLARGRGYRTGYLSLTRGDGGQNELGRDFDERLGVLRTQELIAARKLDNGHQFFTRAIDFGYSKTPEETLRFWDRDQVLADVVRIYRKFRPDVVVTRFPIPPGSGGHGHHTASAMLAVEAFKLAGNPNAYPEQLAQGLTPWQPKRVLWNVFRFGGNADAPLPLPGPTFILDIAGTDPVTGEAFGLIAAHSRAMHKTQGLGGFVTRARTGANEQTFLLMAGEPANARSDADLMDGVETSWARYEGGREIDGAIARLTAQFDPANPSASLPALFALRRQLAALPNDPLVADKRAQLERIIQSALGLRVQTTVAQAEVVPGEKITLSSRIDYAATSRPVSHLETRVFAQRASVGPALAAGPNGFVALRPGDERRPNILTLEFALPANTPLTQPYWLREEGEAGIARVSDPALIGLPENPPALRIEHMFQIGDEQLILADEPIHLTNGEGAAKVRRLSVIPPVSLELDSEVFYVSPGNTKEVSVEISAARANAHGTVRLKLPAGWSAAPASRPFHLDTSGDKARVNFTITAPRQSTAGAAANAWISAVAEIDGQTYSHQRIELRYAHLPVQLLQPPARARLASFELATRGKTIGYLPGAGDYVAECLAQMGYTVRELTDADLTPAKLAGLDAVVIGVRAFNERLNLAANLPGLFAWVEQGGTVIAQYNRPGGLRATTLAPYKLSIEGPAPRLRVTVETSPVEFLVANHPALNMPNKITPADFDGWVQERGAYFPSSWDETKFTALLAMNDPDEAPLRSSVLIARHGKGHYVYTGLAFFRQLPAGVPGAWRLFANLVSLSDAETK